MARSLATASLAVIGLSLGACVGVDQGLSPHFNPSLYSVNQPIVERTDLVFDASAGAGGIGASERGRLAAWFHSIGLGYGDRISIDQGGGYVDPRTRSAVAEVAAEHGLLISDDTPVTAGPINPGTVRIVVTRLIASVPGCPHWDPMEIGSRITTSPNFGCASNSNLAAMVADPGDLVLGQARAPGGDTASASKAIRQYREAPPTGAQGLQQTSTRERSQ